MKDGKHKSTVTLFKFFLAHQDREQEAWLRAQAGQGLHLAKVSPFGFWTFRRGQAADVVYRVDFSGANSSGDFQQLMADAGWRLAATTVGWEYWCIPVVNGREPQIYTDRVSMAKKFQLLLAVLIGTSLPIWMLLASAERRAMLAEFSTSGMVIFGSLFAVYLLLVPYAMVRVLLRVREIRTTLVE
ncbi:DUF2812 domain-containing protein [Massilia sp. Leaf139]|uniref:DUF2812 domain-containing protein n=1 Tax=Massilia sp. Leaf139 TaxID=1736272 RepID=UPI0006F26507|nr:DUF2812 domain-containing protein [Massilia sp. Leaf139]KQQ88517.1 hypothetical protein ASF77_12730 [Massilia sp. Leaf139]